MFCVPSLTSLFPTRKTSCFCRQLPHRDPVASSLFFSPPPPPPPPPLNPSLLVWMVQHILFICTLFSFIGIKTQALLNFVVPYLNVMGQIHMGWPRAFHKLLEISKKVSCNFSKSCLQMLQKGPKLLFVAIQVAQNLLKKTKTFCNPLPLFDMKQK